MANDNLRSYPGFDVSFLVPRDHDPDQLDTAIARIKSDIEDSAGRNLPAGCRVELLDTA
jgi:hypothetical protein